MSLFFKGENNSWYPTPLTRGPFHGLQGGVVSALMCSELNEIAEHEGLGVLSSLSVQFLGSTPECLLLTRPELVKNGRRSSFLVNEVIADGKQTAVASANYVQPKFIGTIPRLKTIELVPDETAKVEEPQAPHGQPWVMDAFELRNGIDNTVWFQQQTPLVENEDILTSLVITSDWAHGLNRPEVAEVADPNLNLNISLFRPPEGRWVGIKGFAKWNPIGLGFGGGEVWDEFGKVGMVGMSIALMPMVA